MRKRNLLISYMLLATVMTMAQSVTKQYDDAIRGDGFFQFNYTGGGWVNAASFLDPYYNNTVSYSNQKDNYVTFKLAGGSFVLFGSKASHHGIAGISIDNGPEIKVDMYATSRINNADIYRATLVEGYHTVKIRVTGTKNPAATNTYVIVDYILSDYKTSHASGLFALKSDLRGFENTAVGVEALASDIEGYNNTAVGYKSLFSNVGVSGPSASGVHNTAVGANSLLYNQGGFNTAVGSEAMYYNIAGRNCNAFGNRALFNNRGIDNTGLGSSTLFFNQEGNGNVAVGNGSLVNSYAGSGNVAIGVSALAANRIGNNNTGLGYGAGTSNPGDVENSTAIGYLSSVTGSNQIRLGNSSVTSIGGQVSWSTLSDGRFKKDVKEDVSGLAFIEKLRPVSYTVDKDAFDKFLRIPDSLRNKSEARKKIARQTGFVAQEVEDIINKTGYIFAGVEAPQSENDHYSIRYAEFVVPLVKAVQELSATVKDQSTKLELLTRQLETIGGAANDKIVAGSEMILYQNNPNPFSVETEIRMLLSESTISAVLIIYTLEGQQLKNIPIQGRGNTKVKVGASELPAGMYLYALMADGTVVDTKRMILTK